MAILILTGYDDGAATRQLLRLGVRGYLTKGVPPRVIVAAIGAIAAGQSVFAPEVVADAAAGERDELTAREAEVLRLLTEGCSNPAIADALYVSVSTVEFHLTHIYQKLGVRSRTEAVAKCHDRGLLQEAARNGS